MSFKIEIAQRKQARLRIGVTGASGSGKTMSSLKLAHGIIEDWSKIVVIDTEQGSSSLYSHLGPFSVMRFDPPYHPVRYAEAIAMAGSAGFEMIIIDSISHEWDGPGGILELHQKAGGQFQSWNKVTPLHKGFIDSILQSKSHVIVTMRAKADWHMDKDEGSSRMKVSKVGLKPTQREGFEYELTVDFRINDMHLASISKDRTGLFTDPIPFEINEAIGKKIRLWNEDGAAQAPIPVPSSEDTAQSTYTHTNDAVLPFEVPAAAEKEVSKSSGGRPKLESHQNKIYALAKSRNIPNKSLKDILNSLGFNGLTDVPWEKTTTILRAIEGFNLS